MQRFCWYLWYVSRFPNSATVVKGIKRGYFELPNVIGEQHQDIFSPDLIAQFQARTIAQDKEEAIRTLIMELLSASKLNTKQDDFLDKAFKGVKSNVIILEGLPGTGKSLVLGLLIVVLLLPGKKVVATAQSNAALGAERERVV